MRKKVQGKTVFYGELDGGELQELDEVEVPDEPEEILFEST